MSTGFDGSIEALQEQSRKLAQSEEARQQWLSEITKKGDLVPQVAQLWSAAVESRPRSAGINNEGKIQQVSLAEANDEQMNRAIICARIIRNAVVGVAPSQVLCFAIVPSIIKTLWSTTSFAFEKDAEIQVFTRTLVQLLSNLITLNEELQSRLWYETLCTNEKADNRSRSGADLFDRLLQSVDAATSTAAQILLLNCTLSSTSRSLSLSTSRSGTKLLRSLLEIVQLHLDNDEKDEEGEERQQALLDSDSAIDVPLNMDQKERDRRHKRYESMGVLYALFTNLFDQQLFGPIFAQLAPVDVFAQEGLISLVHQSQLTLLKLLDSYLHYGAATYRQKETANGKRVSEGLEELMTSLERLAAWAEEAMTDALKGTTKAQVDPRLVEVHLALVLQLQCLITLGMKTENNKESTAGEITKAAIEILLQMRSKTFVLKLVSLLHTLAEFAPPISPFRPTSTTSETPVQPPPGHRLSTTGASVSGDAAEKGPSMDNLKRDLVNLLGVLSYRRSSDDQAEVRNVQDTVRESGGLFDVMNMTQLDEHNPYIRERAIFTLRSLLLGNQVSQDLIAQLKPVA